MLVHPYQEQAHVISLYKDTNIRKLPPGSVLYYDILDDKHAKAFLNVKKVSLTQQKCFFEAFQPFVPYAKLDNLSYSFFDSKTSMDNEKDSSLTYNPYCVIINIGSEVVFSLSSSTFNDSFIFPKNSALVLKNSTEYTRGFLRGYGVFDNHKVVDEDRMGIVLRSLRK